MGCLLLVACVTVCQSFPVRLSVCHFFFQSTRHKGLSDCAPATGEREMSSDPRETEFIFYPAWSPLLRLM